MTEEETRIKLKVINESLASALRAIGVLIAEKEALSRSFSLKLEALDDRITALEACLKPGMLN